ncbi:Protein FAR1-RELATED SEQUENCE [Abeliophyllum distichum]|uniref:Protein FAR1-RELATED SEQUENCE n=1 Tax=Abeliophyllum distichum TaxID=126358 RepID=A0ABD1RFQ7_9LAMI
MCHVYGRNRGNTRIGCNSRLSILKQQIGNLWVVNKFVEEHNHPLTTPSRVHLLRSHRNVSATKKALTQQFSEANIPTCQQLRLMETDSGVTSRKKQVLLLPDKYIVRRWTKNAKENIVFSEEGSSSTSLMACHGMFAHKSLLLLDDAALTDARTTFLIEEFKILHIRIKDIDDGGNVAMSRSKSREESYTIHDPSVV